MIRPIPMTAKVCRKCTKEKLLGEFYEHSGMTDGHLNECKDCVKSRVRKHRAVNVEEHRERDQVRYATSERRRQQHAEALRRSIANHPERQRARMILNNAVRAGKLERPEVCSRCKKVKPRIQGHHPDYTKPLAVVWCCLDCHLLLDKEQHIK